MSDQPPEGTQPLKISAVFQLDPVWLHEQPGTAFSGNLELFTSQLTAYLAHNLERFGEPRSADVLLMVYVQRGEENAGLQYRTGHFLQEEAAAPDPAGPAGHPAAAADDQPVT